MHSCVFIVSVILLWLISTVSSVATDERKLVCYFTNWANGRAQPWSYDVENIPLNTCTHLIYSFVGLDTRSWGVKILSPRYDLDRNGFRRFTSLKKQDPTAKYMVAIGGWAEGGKNYSDMVTEPGRRQAFVYSVLRFLQDYGFDGLDLDWEYPGDSSRGGKETDKENFSLLVKELHEAFKPNGHILSAAVPLAAYTVTNGYDVPSLNEYLHQIHLMAYDMRGQWTGYADVHTPLFSRPNLDKWDNELLNVANGSQLWVDRGMSRDKMAIGIAFYGRSFRLASSSNYSLGAELDDPATRDQGPFQGNFTLEPGYVAYFEICQELKNSVDWVEYWDSFGRVPFVGKGKDWIGYESAESVRKKMTWLQELGYGGGMIWAIDLDDYQGSCSARKHTLLTVMQEELRPHTLSRH